MSESQVAGDGLGRRFVVAVAAASLGVVWVHALAGVLRSLGPEHPPLAATALTVIAVTLALGAAALPARLGAGQRALAGAGAGLAAVVVLEALAPGSWWGSERQRREAGADIARPQEAAYATPSVSEEK